MAGVPGVRFDAERFADSLRAVALLSAWEGTTILTLRPADAAELFQLFEALRDIKPTERKWVGTSKTLHHLLPDLILPMDNLITAPFLGRSSLPRGAPFAVVRKPDDGDGSHPQG